MQNNLYIKMPKEFVKLNMSAKDKKGLLIAYLFFHTTYDRYVYTTIDCICDELKLSTKSHGTRRSQNIIKDLLTKLIQEDIIQFVSTSYCEYFDQIQNNQLFKIKLNNQSNFFNLNSNYIRIEKYEYDTIMSINSQHLNKIFNIFYQIKSYVCMDDNCVHMCYPSIHTLCKLCNCSDNTITSTINLLCENKLMYIYKLNDQEQITINKNIKYIFAMEQYSKQDILNEFAA